MTLAEANAALDAYLAKQAGRFAVSFYVIHDHFRDPNAPYFASANMISSGMATPPVIPMMKNQDILAVPGGAEPLP